MVPLMCVAFLVGLARWWVFIAHSTRRLAARLRSHPGPEDLRQALAEAFDDPSLEIVYWLEDGPLGGRRRPPATPRRADARARA